MKKLTAIFLLVVLLTIGISSLALADGTETLGSPSISIASGSGILVAGTGLETQPGTFTFDVPAPVVQVILYWEGQSVDPFPTDDTIVVEGIPVRGTLIGGPTDYGYLPWRIQSYRADITALGLVTQGSNTLTVEGMDFNFANDGAGVLVIYDDGVNTAEIDVRDGNDFVFINFAPPLDSTVPQTFNFAPADSERTANLALLVGSIADDRTTPQPERPSVIEVTVNGVTTYFRNELSSVDGRFWDSFNRSITIPAGATSLKVQIFSRDDLNTGFLPASLTWIGAGLSVPEPPPPPDGEGCTPGFWRNPKKFDLWPIDPNTLFSNVFFVGPDDALMNTIRLGGGGEKALIRHSTAAYLNALSPDVDYFYAPDEVIDIVQEAYSTGDFDAAKNTLEAQNDPTFCPLSK